MHVAVAKQHGMFVMPDGEQFASLAVLVEHFRANALQSRGEAVLLTFAPKCAERESS